MRILAISGSLRSASSNTRLLLAAAALAPAGVEVAVEAGLGELPHFNPDREGDDLGAVTAWRARLESADALLICSPEYAHGVPGTLKNALDWVVGSGELIDKPLGLINAAPHAHHAQDSLAETLSVMTGWLVPGASVAVTLRDKSADPDALAADPDVSAALRGAIAALRAAIASGRPAS